MSSKYVLFLIIFVALTELIMEGIKNFVKLKMDAKKEKYIKFYNSKYKAFVYGVIALIPSLMTGFILANIEGEATKYYVIAHSSAIYVIQYLCGISIVAKIKEVVPTWVDKIIK